MKLVGADEQILIYSSNSLQWLSSTNLLEMLVDRLGPNVSLRRKGGREGNDWFPSFLERVFFSQV